MNEYRYERGTWTSGFGDTYNVLDVFHDDTRGEPFARLIVNDDGTCERMTTMGGVYFRTERNYASVDDAYEAMVAGHRAWRSDVESGEIPDWTTFRGALADREGEPA